MFRSKHFCALEKILAKIQWKPLLNKIKRPNENLQIYSKSGHGVELFLIELKRVLIIDQARMTFMSFQIIVDNMAVAPFQVKPHFWKVWIWVSVLREKLSTSLPTVSNGGISVLQRWLKSHHQDMGALMQSLCLKDCNLWCSTSESWVAFSQKRADFRLSP